MRSGRVIHAEAVIGEASTVGYFSVIEAGVRVGKNCRIGNRVTILADSEIGEGVRIDDGTVIGKRPLRAARSQMTDEQELPPLRLGDGVLVGSHVVLYRGATIGARVLVADGASVREDVEVGEETIIGRSVSIENHCRIGARVKIETGAYITGLSRIGDDCFVAPMVTTTNDNFVGRSEARFRHFGGAILERGARLGAGSTVLPGKRLGEDSLVAAHAVVTRDVPPGVVVRGVPAHVVGPVPRDQQLPPAEVPHV